MKKEYYCVVCGRQCERKQMPSGKWTKPKTCSDECLSKLISQQTKEQMAKMEDRFEQEFERKFNTKYAGRFVYVGGYEWSESIIECECLLCGHHEHITAQCVRNRKTCGQYTIECSGCREIEREAKKQQQREQRKKQQEEKARIKKEQIEIETKEYEKKLQKLCIECGKQFKANTLKEKICSDECKRKRKNRMHDVNRREKLKENGKVDYSISLTKLIKKDKGVCRLCGYKVNPKDYEVRDNAFIAKDMYPSIDHIVPVSKGGTHTWDNVQLAHRYCNTIKNDERRWMFVDGDIKEARPTRQVVAL